MDFDKTQVVRSKRKTIAIIIQKDGSVQIRAPRFATSQQIQLFVQSKMSWIQSHQAKILKLKNPAHKYEPGEKFLFLGNKYPLELSKANSPFLLLDGKFHLGWLKQQDAEKVFTEWYRKRAREIITERANLLAKQHSYVFKKIRISSARTRWGSCSPKGTLSFTWRLVLAPMEIIDYVIIHELVHLNIKDHSSAFWSRVQDIDPDYRKKRRWLREHGHLLTL